MYHIWDRIDVLNNLNLEPGGVPFNSQNQVLQSFAYHWSMLLCPQLASKKLLWFLDLECKAMYVMDLNQKHIDLWLWTVKRLPWTLAEPQSFSDILNLSLTLFSSSFIFSADDKWSGWKYCREQLTKSHPLNRKKTNGPKFTRYLPLQAHPLHQLLLWLALHRLPAKAHQSWHTRHCHHQLNAPAALAETTKKLTTDQFNQLA